MTASTTQSAQRSTDGVMSPRRFYRIVAVAESVTWTLLIAGMILKYVVGLGPLPVQIGGSIHGFVFITYALTAALIGVNQRWSFARIAAAVATAVVPYATIPFDRHLERQGLLEGGWQREATDDPADRTWPRVLLRRLLNHPVVLIALFAIGVVAIMATLLVAGPPGEWGAQ